MATDSTARIVLTAKDDTAPAFAKAKAALASFRAQADASGSTLALIGVASAAAAVQIAELARALETLDRLDDLAEKSGIAVEQLSALRFAGETAGTTFEDLAGGLRKLATNMADAAGGGKQTAAAFDALGVNVKDLRGNLRGSNDVLLDLADAFSRYRDGAGKSALATQIFGRAGETLIPLLNQGSDGIRTQTSLAEKLGAVYSGDLAKSAADFNDNMKRLALASEGAKAALLGGFLPALNDSIDGFIRAKSEGRLLEETFARLGNLFSGKQGIDFAFGGDKGAVAQASGALDAVQAKVEATQAQITVLEQRAKDGNLTKGSTRRLDELRSELNSLKADASSASAALTEAQRRVAKFGEGHIKGFDNRPEAPVSDKTGGVARDEGLSQLNALLDKIKERSEADKLQLAINRDLTDSEKFAVDIETKLTGAKSKLSDAQQEVVRARLADVKALDRQLETRALLRAAADSDFKAEQEAIALIEQQTEARLQENRGLFDQIATLGMTSRELDNYRTKQLEVALAVEQGTIATAKAMGAGDGELLVMRDKAALLQKQIDLHTQLAAKNAQAEDDPLAGATRAIKTYAESLTKAGNDTEKFVTDSLNSLETGIADALTGKAIDVHGIVDQIISEFIRLKVVKPLLSDIFGSTGTNGSGAGVINGLLGIFGGFKASGGSVSAGVPVITGERGRELFVPQVDGTIVPNSALQGGGDVFDFSGQQIYVGQGVSRSEVAAALQASNRQVKSDILRSKRRAGAFE